MKDSYNYFGNAAANVARAKKHTLYLEEYPYSEYNEISAQNAKVFTEYREDTLDKCVLANDEKRPTVRLSPRTTVDYVLNSEFEITREPDVVLDFADYLDPGGKFMEGGIVQEESLCHSSNLFNILKSERLAEEFYWPNREEFRKSGNFMYSDKGIMIPRVMFRNSLRDDDRSVDADVIVLAAPNYRHKDCTKVESISEEEYLSILRSRIETIFKIAYETYSEECLIYPNMKRALVLGAFGCGEFRNDPKIVAEIMVDCINKGYANLFTEVVFAIPPGYNYSVFRQVIRRNLYINIEE